MATEYGNRLRTARKLRGMTQVDLSKVTGIPQSTISTAEREGTKSLETTTYATALKIRPEWLATGEGEMEPTLPQPQQVIRKPVTLLNVGSIPLLNQGNTKLLDSYMDGTADHQPPNITYHSDDTTGLIAYTVPDDLNEPRIPNGCTAIINMNAEPVHGKLALIQDGERSYIRRLIIDGDLRYQETVSGRLPPRPLTGHIIGVVKEVIISMD